MPRHTETRRLPYTPEQMFDLVADVGRYGEFLPWVVAVRVRKDAESEMVADLVVGFKSLRETFTSKVKKDRPRSIDVDYVEGPLKYLHNSWKFRPDGEAACIVDFCVDFAFKNKVFEMLAGQVFDKALRRMTNAFEERADALYGSLDSDSTVASGISNSSAHNAA